MGDVKELGDLGPHLARLGIGAVASAEDKVELLPLEGLDQGAGGGQRIGAGHGPVAEVYGAIGAHGQALHQRLPRLVYQLLRFRRSEFPMRWI